MQPLFHKTEYLKTIFFIFLISADFPYLFKCQKNLCFSTLTSSLLTDCCAHIHIYPTPVSRLSGVIPFPEGAMKSCVKMLEVQQLKKENEKKKKKKNCSHAANLWACIWSALRTCWWTAGGGGGAGRLLPLGSICFNTAECRQHFSLF